jgi:hypothetical protein
MKNLFLSARARFTLGVCLASVVALLISETRASAQQGVFITQASARLSKLVDKGNDDGYKLQNNSFSIGGGWLKKSNKWVAIYSVQLTAGKEYRFLASGDNDAKDVDLRVLNAKGNEVAVDDATAADAVVNFSPQVSGIYLVQIRLYDSRNDLDAVCLSVMMAK